jgi:hypothetical protein
MKSTQEIWREGFRAGQIVVGQCPYPLESPEARVWHNGYGLGLFKGENPCGAEVPPERAAGRWHALLRRLVGH